MTDSIFCYCGSDLTYIKCCQQYVENIHHPKTAEQLMRSRFTAFKLAKHQYLIDTFQTDKNLEAGDFNSDQRIWLGLSIISKQKGQHGDSQGVVEFVAFFRDQSMNIHQSFEQLHEISNFIKVKGRWLYENGKILPDIKLSRNERCFCQSGLKFKKCHGV